MSSRAIPSKKTIHLNTNLETHQMILKFFELKNGGRSFSTFTKDLLYEEAKRFFVENPELLSNTVESTDGNANIPLGNNVQNVSVKTENSEPQKENDSVASAVSSMFAN